MNSTKNYFILKNVDFIPLKGNMANFTAGFFKDGKIIKSSLLTRNFTDHIWRNRIPIYINPKATVSGEYIFGGHIFFHYGHFLLESLSRIRHLLRYTGLPTIFFTESDYFSAWQNEIFEVIGFKNKIIVSNEPVKFECVLFTNPDCILHDYISCNFIDTLSQYEFSKPNTQKNIWVSRSNLNGGGLINEKQLENILSELGWTIFHPEDFSIKDQIEILANSKNIAGLDGSAFYTLLLAKNVESNVMIISRRGFIPKTLIEICKHKIKHYNFCIPKIKYIDKKGAEARFEAIDLSAILSFIQEKQIKNSS